MHLIFLIFELGRNQKYGINVVYRNDYFRFICIQIIDKNPNDRERITENETLSINLELCWFSVSSELI